MPKIWASLWHISLGGVSISFHIISLSGKIVYSPIDETISPLGEVFGLLDKTSTEPSGKSCDQVSYVRY